MTLIMGCSATTMNAYLKTEANSHSTDVLDIQNANEVHRAIQEFNFQEACQLIQRGHDINCINYLGRTPLIEACRMDRSQICNNKHVSFVKFLLNNGSDIRRTDIYGWTALLYAKENRHVIIVKMLERIEYRTSIIEKRVDDEFALVATSQ